MLIAQLTNETMRMRSFKDKCMMKYATILITSLENEIITKSLKFLTVLK